MSVVPLTSYTNRPYLSAEVRGDRLRLSVYAGRFHNLKLSRDTLGAFLGPVERSLLGDNPDGWSACWWPGCVVKSSSFRGLIGSGLVSRDGHGLFSPTGVLGYEIAVTMLGVAEVMGWLMEKPVELKCTVCGGGGPGLTHFRAGTLCGACSRQVYEEVRAMGSADPEVVGKALRAAIANRTLESLP